MNAALMPFSSFRRPTFIGKTDKYAPPVSTNALDPAEMASILAAVKDTEVSAPAMSDGYINSAANRLTAYKQFWRLYEGKHFDNELDGEVRRVAFNWCRAIVDKRVTWGAGKSMRFVASHGNEDVAEILMRVWKVSGGTLLIRRLLTSALVTGDSFLYFTRKVRDEAGNPLPLDKQYVKAYPIDPSYVFPVWKESDPSKPAAVYLQFPVWDSTAGSSSVLTVLHTPKKTVYYKNGARVREVENKTGLLPVVHIANGCYGSNLFGTSVLEDIGPLNIAYNETRHSIRRIIRYHGEPTTLVFGTRFSSMERGANRLWSNLPPPKDADVRNLEMKGDLAAFTSELEETKRAMFMLGKTPEACFDSKGLAISNTSGVAMSLMMQPLIEASLEAQASLSQAILEGNRIIAAIHKNVFNEDIRLLADDEEFDDFDEITPVFESMLPRDKAIELDYVAKQLELRTISRAQAMRILNADVDTARLSLEISADENQALAMKAEEYKALQGQMPNFNATLLSSALLHEDVVDMLGVAAKDKDGNRT